eukprot:2973-Prymnesium_polylepis.1
MFFLILLRSWFASFAGFRLGFAGFRRFLPGTLLTRNWPGVPGGTFEGNLEMIADPTCPIGQHPGDPPESAPGTDNSEQSISQ